MEHVYLKPNVMIEPLIDQWYAWSHLLPPQTAARNITERHLRIMDSYVSAPEVHAAAVKNPKMLGGPFMDYGTNQSEKVKALAQQTRCLRRHLVGLSEAIAELDQLLAHEAKGYSLESLFVRIPCILRGYVELVYDLTNHASFRFVEPLLYRSRYYDRSMQSLMLSHISSDDRPFVLSTPRLDDGDGLHLRLPFDDEGADALFRMRRLAGSFSSMRDILQLSDRTANIFRSFLTTERPRVYQPYLGPGARWRYFGHACVLLETNAHSFMVDPVLSYTYQSDVSRYTYEDLPNFIDYVLITHNHQDHILFETLLQLRHRIGTVIVPRNGGGSLQDPSLKLLLENCGFHNVREISDLESIEFDGGTVLAVPFFGEHGDLAINTKTGYVIFVNGHSLFFAADSCNIEPKLYEHLHAQIGDIEVLFLGMECDGAPVSWLYGPLLTKALERGMDQSRRFAGSNFKRGINIVEQFRCKEVYVYAMGQEPWLNYIMSLKYTEDSNPIVQSNMLIQTCRERGIVSERLFGEKEILLP